MPTVRTAGRKTALTYRRVTLVAQQGPGVIAFTLLAPSLALLLLVCPRLTEDITGPIIRLLAKVSIDILGLARNLLIITRLLSELNRPLRTTEMMVVPVLLCAAVTTMFPFRVRLLVPTIAGTGVALRQARVVLTLLNILQVVAGTLHPPTRPPENIPSFLTTVVPVWGLK